eukprot:6181211-Pleurochrysis_carterae.AAC.3
MNKFYTELQRRLLAVLHPNIGAEPHINHGLHIRGSRYHVKHSLLSDASDRVARDIQRIPPSAYIAVKACQ